MSLWASKAWRPPPPPHPTPHTPTVAQGDVANQGSTLAVANPPPAPPPLRTAAGEKAGLIIAKCAWSGRGAAGEACLRVHLD